MQNTKQRFDVRKLCVLALFSAVAVVLTAFVRIPIMPAAPFLKLDVKDVLIGIMGLAYGPLTAALMSLVVSLIEMITVSESFLWGMLMNVISTCSFVCVASWIYKKRKTALSAAVGLIIGILLLTASMLLWNYLITPIYQGWPRETVAAMLPTVFLPFNLIKGAINAALILLLYKPVMNVMRKAGAIPQSNKPELVAEGTEAAAKPRMNIGVALLALLLLASAVLFILVQAGVM